jgi:hypothetical protein
MDINLDAYNCLDIYACRSTRESLEFKAMTLAFLLVGAPKAVAMISVSF